MNLFKKLSLESYKQQVYDRWIIFSHLTPEDSMFSTYDEKLNSDLDFLFAEFSHVPAWKEDFLKHSFLYFDCMKFKVSSKKGLIPANHFTPINLN
jgi:hypothetical protein